ncbi:6-hydroxymellein synthase cdmE [Cladobotryum mycophilum]|uniref:6-hydroxymellein synthase cdmE n=1 Tax=Cladobotryum mycophilum TaxID=491253 RepID=A0ABR0S851_9HYPO
MAFDAEFAVFSNTVSPHAIPTLFALIVSCILIPVATWCLSTINSRQVAAGQDKEPPVAPYTLPYFQHMIAFLSNPDALYKKMRDRYGSKPFSLMMMNTKFHVFGSAATAQTVFGRSRDFIFEPVMESMFDNGMSLPAEDMRWFKVPVEKKSSLAGKQKHDTELNPRAFVEGNHRLWVKYLSGKWLDDAMDVYISHLGSILGEVIGLDQLSSDNWIDIDLHEAMQRIIFEASVVTFLGHASVRYGEKACGRTSKRLMIQPFEEWVTDGNLPANEQTETPWTEEWGFRLNVDRQKLAEKYGFTVRGQASFHAAFLFVIITNSAPMATWLLLSIIVSPTRLARFRKEIHSYLLPTDPRRQPDDLRFDLEGLRTNQFVHGVWNEAIRLGSQSAAARVVTEDTELEGYVLRKGSVILLPVRLLHFDEDVFPSANKFMPERWIFSSEDVSHDELDEKKARFLESQRKQQASLRAFGGGTSLCSGRHIAEKEVLSLVSTLLLLFDFDIKDVGAVKAPDDGSIEPVIRLNPRSLGMAIDSNGPENGAGASLNDHTNSQINGNAHIQTTDDVYDFGDATEPMAIIGLATRFPQDATTTGNLWELLLKGRSAWSPFPEDRIGEGHYHPDPEHGGTFAVKGGHFLKDDPAFFDAPFFSITRSEVLTMDPQQRIVLENVYHALENAGIPMATVNGSATSVYVSGFNHDHLANLNMDVEATMKYKPTGTTNSLLSNRVSWFFNLRGPSMTLDTACSSSMVAMHLACQSLACSESQIAIVSGVTLIGFPTDIINMGNHGFLGQDGRCFTFDHRANGYSRGEGVGTIVVKRLRDALKDGDVIRAVVRGTAVNQDGRTPGVSLPSGQAQESLIRSIYERTKLDFKDTRMVESHGTGTAAGDPIEAAALAKVFAPSRSQKEPLIVGALKSSIGHLEGGAGVASIIKGVMILESGIIPPNNNFEKVNPKIPIKKWNLTFPLQSMPWPAQGLRRISINSFGVGGTNAHIILDDAFNYMDSRGLNGTHNTVSVPPAPEDIEQQIKTLTESEQAERDRVANGIDGVDVNDKTNENGQAFDSEAAKSPFLFSLSSFDEAGIQRNAEILAAHLDDLTIKRYPSLTQEHTSDYLANLAYTLSAKRDVFPWRSHAIGSSLKDLSTSLKSEPKAVRVRSPPKVGFVFTGQGAQWHAMGRELMVYPAFRRRLEDATEYMSSIGAEWSLIEELSRDQATSQVNQPWLSHPACVSVQMALVDLLRAWNITPSRVVGHSSGEIAAAYAAGRLTQKAAWKAAYFRGVVSQRQLGVKGAMMAVGMTAEKLQPLINEINAEIPGELVIACYNSPSNHTVAGDEAKVDALHFKLEAIGGVFSKKLNLSNAYHSSHMLEVADEYLSNLGFLVFGEEDEALLDTVNAVELFSSVTGARVTERHLGAQYWVDNMVSPVRFHEALSAMCFSRTADGQASLKMNANAENIFADTILEIGPHSALRSAIKETLSGKISTSLYHYLSPLSRTSPGLHNVLDTIGSIMSLGLPVNIGAVNYYRSDLQPQKLRVLTDLPPYVFNHSERNCFESRLSKNFRLRRHPRHDLLGAPVPDWNKETPRWRHIIRVSEQPWLKDHVVTNLIIYPGVGYLAAILEASRQIADADQTITGFRMRDISLKRALIIPETKEGVEIAVSLTRKDEASLQGSAIWKRFSITSYDPLSDDWAEHCTGYVATDYAEPNNPIDAGREEREEANRFAKALTDARERCLAPVDIDRTYEELVTAGLNFGPLFKNLSGVLGTGNRGGEALATVTVPDVEQVMPKNFTHDHLIHPATMDSFLHLFLASVMDGMGRKTLDRAMVPTFMKEVWISASIKKNPKDTYIGHGRSTLLAFDKFQSDITVWDGSSEAALLSIKGIRGTPLETADTASYNKRSICHQIEDVISPELLTKTDLSVQLTEEAENDNYRTWINKLQLATVLRVTDALQELDQSGFDASRLEGHFAKYYDWMQHVKSLLDNDQIRAIKLSEWLDVNGNADKKTDLYKYVADFNAEGELAMRMGSNIAKVVRKEEDPLHLMFGIDDLLDRVYASLVGLGDLPAYTAAYLDVVRKSSNNIRILEVGAGVGSSTASVLEILAPTIEKQDGSSDVESHVSKYTFTDISAGFFEKAREKFKAYGSIMEYKAFNAEKDAAGQGLELASYDYIFAGNVVHATADLRKTLGNIRRLLKPGGRLVLQEGVRQDNLWSSIAFGQLTGWWLSIEPERKWSPWISVPQWDGVLRDAGFSGISLNLEDRADTDLHAQSLLIAEAVDNGTPVASSTTWQDTIIITAVEHGSDLAKSLKHYLERKLDIPNCKLLHYLEIASTDVSRSVCVSVVELERGESLASAAKHEFDNLRQLIATCGALLWITGDTTSNPHLNLASGLMRTVRWERDVDEANLVFLSVQEPQPGGESLLASITRLFEQQFVRNLPLDKINGEFTLLPNGAFLTSRLVDADFANGYLTSRLSSPQAELRPLGEAGRPVKLVTASPGQLNMLQFVTDEMYLQPLGETEVEIEIKAVGLNFRDLMIAIGEHNAISIGGEAAGVITRIGGNVKRLAPGDRVAFLSGLEEAGCFQSYGRVDQGVVVKIPDSASFESVAGLPCVYATVIYGLENAARLQKGETILIHAAAGGVGQAAIHYAKYIGAEIYATVSSPEKRELLMNDYNIPEDHIFSSRDASFVKGIMRMTNNRGVDVVLNSLAGELLRASWDIIAPFGRFIEIGKKDAQLNGKVDLQPFLRNVTMSSVELPTMMRYRPQLVHDLMVRTLELFEQGHIREAKPTAVMSFAQIEEGLRILQSGKGMGKMVFVPSPTDVVPVVPPQPAEYKLDSNATYVLAGGLGGIGRSMARWMASKGARHLIFLSRSGKLTGDALKMAQELEQKECGVHVFACDVSDPGRMKEVLDECARALPPIKGCIQGSMVLVDGMFENMSHEAYTSAIKPKVTGSWNLHRMLPRNMDFFVLLSSATGIIGNRAQGNYAAGNTFQDALARHRLSLGLPCSTIDLGTVLSVGYVAENWERTMMGKRPGSVLEVLREEEIQLLIESLMDPRSQIDESNCQLVTGLTTAATFKQVGVPAPTYLSYPLFTHLRAIKNNSGSAGSGSGSDPLFMLQSQLMAATTIEEASAVVLEGVRNKLASLLATPLDNINTNKSMSSHGVDSLVALELRTYFVKDLGADIALLDITGTASIASLALKIASASTLTQLQTKEGDK